MYEHYRECFTRIYIIVESRVRSFVDKVTLGQVFSECVGCPLSVQFLSCSILIHSSLTYHLRYKFAVMEGVVKQHTHTHSYSLTHTHTHTLARTHIHTHTHTHTCVSITLYEHYRQRFVTIFRFAKFHFLVFNTKGIVREYYTRLLNP